MNENEIGKLVVHYALQVHQQLGPGLLESAYQTCLIYELHRAGMYVKKRRVCL